VKAQWQGGKTGGVHASPAGLYTPGKTCILLAMRFASLLPAFLVFLTLVLPAWSQAKAPLQGPKVEEFTLDNGMRFLLIPDPQSTAVIHSLWYQVGAGDEPPGKSGLAHFLEHLMYKGTAKNPPGTYGDAVASDGAAYNAFTSNDVTVMHVRVPKPLLARVMELEADRMRGLILEADPMETERQIIKEERRERVENRPETILMERMDEILFKGQPYALPVSGYQPEIDTATIADAKTFYETNYHPQNAISIVAGNIDLEELKVLAEEYFASVPRGPERKRRPPVPLAADPDEQYVERISETATQRLVLIGFAVPGFTPDAKPDPYALDFLATILASGTQGRLVERLVLQDKSALDVDVDYDGYRRHGASFMIRAPLNTGVDPAGVRKAIEEVIADIAKNGVSADEIRTALQRSEVSAVYGWDSQSTIVNNLGSVVSAGLPANDAFSLKRWYTVTPQQVQDVANRFLAPNRSVTGVLIPEKEAN
jgi:zinc protease